MFPLVLETPFIKIDGLFPAGIVEQNMIPEFLKILIHIPLLSIQRSEQGHIPEGNPKNLHQIQGQRVRLGTGLMKEAKGRIQPHDQNGIDDGAMEEAIAKGEQGVETIFRRPAVSPGELEPGIEFGA